MGVKHTVLLADQPTTVAFNVLAQLCSPNTIKAVDTLSLTLTQAIWVGWSAGRSTLMLD